MFACPSRSLYRPAQSAPQSHEMPAEVGGGPLSGRALGRAKFKWRRAGRARNRRALIKRRSVQVRRSGAACATTAWPCVRRLCRRVGGAPSGRRALIGWRRGAARISGAQWRRAAGGAQKWAARNKLGRAQLAPLSYVTSASSRGLRGQLGAARSRAARPSAQMSASGASDEAAANLHRARRALIDFCSPLWSDE